MKKLFLIGGGGHCKSCIDVIEQEGKFQIVGIFDMPEKVGQKVFGYPIIDSDENIEKYINDESYFFISIGQLKSPEARIRIFNKNLNWATIISPNAYVSKYAQIGKGTIVMHHAMVNAGSVIGDNCIINSKALIEHDSCIGNHCHISTGAIINGDCKVGDKTFIGSNTVLKNERIVPAETLITYGSKA